MGHPACSKGHKRSAARGGHRRVDMMGFHAGHPKASLTPVQLHGRCGGFLARGHVRLRTSRVHTRSVRLILRALCSSVCSAKPCPARGVSTRCPRPPFSVLGAASSCYDSLAGCAPPPLARCCFFACFGRKGAPEPDVLGRLPGDPLLVVRVAPRSRRLAPPTLAPTPRVRPKRYARFAWPEFRSREKCLGSASPKVAGIALCPDGTSVEKFRGLHPGLPSCDLVADRWGQH